VETLTAIQEGKLPLAMPVGAALLERLHELLAVQRQRAGQAFSPELVSSGKLTEREQEVLRMIQQRASNQEIAAALMIQVGTVKNHVHSILKKLNVSSREHAAQYLDLIEQ
jgi:DNA-binding NarL/FixJ family response regulator